MDAQAIAKRLYVSMSNASEDTVRSLLLTFGVTNPTKTDMPIVFDPKYDAQWRTFIGGNQFEAPNHELSLLYTILEFVRYMRAGRMNPFIRRVKDPQTRAPLDPSKVYKRLFVSRLSDRMTDIANSIRKFHLEGFLQRRQTFDYVKLEGRSIDITSYAVLTPTRKGDDLDQVLLKLRGLLYSGKLPIQLGEIFKLGSNKSSLPEASSLALPVSSNFGWLSLVADKTKRISMRRARGNKLILRISTSLHNEIDMGNNSDVKRIVLQAWKSLRTAAKL